MKLRIKYNSNRTTIDIPDDGTLSDVTQQCHTICPDGNWYLSLNGTDEITSSMEESVTTIGLVSGDLLHIVKRKADTSSQLVMQLLQMGFQKNSAEKAVLTFGATSVNDAIELLNMLGESNSSGSSYAMSLQADETSTMQQDAVQPEINQKQPVEPVDITNTSTNIHVGSEQSNQTDDQVMLLTPSKKMPPLFLQDGITDSFRELFNQGKCDTEADYLCLVAHALILEAGFRTKVESSPCSAGTNELEHRHTVAVLPSKWRNADMGLYRFNYIHNTSGDFSCCVTGSVAGRFLLLTCTLDTEDSDAFQVKLKISDYVNTAEMSTGEPDQLYLNLGRLSRKVKDSLTTKIINEIREKLGLGGNIFGWTSLPQEVQVRLLCYLDIVSVCRMAQVAREMRVLCEDDLIWKRLLRREFKAANLVGTTFKQAVKHMYLMRREELLREQRLQTPRTPLRPDFDIGPDLIYPRGGPVMPGIIGGGYDLYPSGGYQPGGFPGQPSSGPSSPFHPDILRDRHPIRNNIRRPPGARYNPLGPALPDDDYHSADRRQHPDSLHRPSFGRGFGGGAGGFGGFI